MNRYFLGQGWAKTRMTSFDWSGLDKDMLTEICQARGGWQRMGRDLLCRRWRRGMDRDFYGHGRGKNEYLETSGGPNECKGIWVVRDDQKGVLQELLRQEWAYWFRMWLALLEVSQTVQSGLSFNRGDQNLWTFICPITGPQICMDRDFLTRHVQKFVDRNFTGQVSANMIGQ